MNPSLQSLGELAVLAAIRTFPNFFLQRELEVEAHRETKVSEPMATAEGEGLKAPDPFLREEGLPMNERPKKRDLSSELARERTREGADRTLMAWIRTALSLIGFGFAIASFRDILLEGGLIRNPHKEFNGALVFGLSFVSLGVLGLLAATLQHWNILQHLKQDDFSYNGFRPLVFIMAILLMCIGALAFVAILR